MKRFFSFILRAALTLFIACVVVAVLSLWTWRNMHEPFRGFPGNEVFVEVERGMTTAQIAERLNEHGVIAKAWRFRALRMMRPGAVLQAGEYRFASPASVVDVFDRLRRGDIYYVTLSFPEGSNIFDMARIVEDSELTHAREFLDHARSPHLIRDLAPKATSLEGFLFPSTYQFRRRATSAEICERLTAEFRKQWAALGGGNDANKIVTLASLVEKETGVANERTQVASVYWNRLSEGMKLDCDPTVIYAALLENRYRGTIYASDLSRDHPYNTYRNAGLPPGPIANPGAASLRAALNPAQTKYLFFVAKGDGSGEHRFSENLAEHQKAVRLYRRAIQTARTSSGNERRR